MEHLQEYLAAPAVDATQKAMEEKIIAACNALRAEGQGIKITLKSSLTANAAKAIYDIRFSFAFSPGSKSALLRVGGNGYKPKPLTITLGYLKRLTGSGLWISQLLAPWVQDIELVSANTK